MKTSFRILCSIPAMLLACAAATAHGAPQGGTERMLRVADDLGTGPVKAVISAVKERSLPEGMVCGSRSLRISRMLESGENVWTIRDGYEECEVDGELKLVDLSVTDLDGDGLAEVWTAYQVGCRGGVDPIAMKIIMYEGVKKHAMRGDTRVPDGNGNTIGGSYRFDDAFRRAPASFRAHAEQIWNAHVDEFKELPNPIPESAPAAPAVPPKKAEPPRPATPPAPAVAPIPAGAPSPAAAAPAAAGPRKRFGHMKLQAEFSQKAMIEFAINEFDMVTPKDADLIRKYGLKPDLDGYDYEICDDDDEWMPFVGFKQECVFKVIGGDGGDITPRAVGWKQFVEKLRSRPDGIDVTFEVDADGILKSVTEYYIP